MIQGIDHQQGDIFSYISPEHRMRNDHPQRAVRAMTGEILEQMSPLFGPMFAESERPSIPPEKLLRAQLLQLLSSVRSERQLEATVAKEVLAAQVVAPESVAGLISDEHFTVDGTLLEAWASLKSFPPRDKQDAPPNDPGNPTLAGC
jgi:transposase